MRLYSWLTCLSVLTWVSGATAQTTKTTPPRQMPETPAKSLPDKPVVVEDKPVTTASPALIKVKVTENATIWFENQKMSQSGGVRMFQSPTLEPKKTYYYKVKVAWPNGSGTTAKEIVSEQEVAVRAGETTTIDFTALMNHTKEASKPTSTRDMIRQAAHSTPAPERKKQ